MHNNDNQGIASTAQSVLVDIGCLVAVYAEALEIENLI